MVRIFKTNDGRVAAMTPYHPNFPARARALGGKFVDTTSGGKAWAFDARDEERVRAICLDIYGTDGTPTDTVTLRVTALADMYEAAGSIYVAGRVLARAFGRDSGAKLGEGVVHLSGKMPNSGGSVRNWRTTVADGSVFEVRDVPRRAALEFIAEHADSCKWHAEIVGEEPVDPKAELRAERDKLLARLAEIDAALGEGEANAD